MKRIKVFGISLIALAFILPGFVYYTPSAINFLNGWNARYSHHAISASRHPRLNNEPVRFVGSCFASIVFLVVGGYLLYLDAKNEEIETPEAS